MFQLYFIQSYNGAIMYSGNAIPFKVAIAPMPLTTYFVIATIKVQLPGNIFLTVKTQKLYLGKDGMVSIDISSIATTYLKHFTPPANLDNYVICAEQLKYFEVSFTLFDGTSNLGTITDFVRIIKAGAAFEYFLPIIGNQVNSIIEKWLLISKWEERVAPDDIFFLHFATADGVIHDYKVLAIVQFLDENDTVQTVTVAAITKIEHGINCSIICIPAGFNQLSLFNSVPDGAQIMNYTLQVFKRVGTADVETALEDIYFEVDSRNFYNKKQLLYRNSLGSLMPITLNGTIEMEGTYEYQNTGKNELSYIKDGNVLGNITQDYASEEWKESGNTGFISKYEAERLRDFFLSTEKYQVKDGRLVSIVVNNKSVKYFTNKDNLFALQIDWSHAFKNNFYSTPSLYNGACPAMLNLFWKQITPNSIAVYYSLPVGYDYWRVELTFPSEPPIYLFVNGNSGMQVITFARPTSAAGAVDLLVKGQVVCNRYNKVPTYGAYFTTVVQSLLPLTPAVAAPDTFNLGVGFITPQVLSPSVLANDYDPAGAVLTVVPVTDDATTAGGLISIDAAGIVTYTPPSGTYTGNDSYTYQMVAGSAAPINGTITFRVTNQTASIYAYAGYSNFTSSGLGESVANFIIMKFSNSPLGITPYAVTNLTVNYRKVVKTYNSADGFTALISTVTTNYTAVFNGAETTVHAGPTPDYVWQVDLSQNKIVTTIEVLPGTGYTPL